jgi:hypothetical protein
MIAMEYRGVEYSVVQVVGRVSWKWRIEIDSRQQIRGEGLSRADAIKAAILAIEKAMNARKRKRGFTR